MNIPSVYGGANLWGETDKKKARRSRAKSGGRGNDLEWAVQGVLIASVSILPSYQFCTVSVVTSATLLSRVSQYFVR